jgi:hypothetical protein
VSNDPPMIAVRIRHGGAAGITRNFRVRLIFQ